jgi:hypothetical protein
MKMLPLLLFLVLRLTLRSEANIAQWNSLVESGSIGSIESIAKSVQSDSSQWPRIGSQYELNKLPRADQVDASARLDLGRKLIKKLQKGIESSESNASDLRSEVATYATLANAASNAGGYTNLLLADLLDQAIFYRLSTAVRANPQAASELSGLLALRSSSPTFDLKSTLKELATQDPLLEEHTQQIDQLKGNENFVALCAIFNSAIPAKMASSSKAMSTTDLLENESGLALVVRLGTTHALLNCVLPGLLEYLEKGGEVAELSSSNNLAFKKRMGESIYKYRAPFIGMQFLDATRVKSILDIQANSEDKKRFLQQALR